MLFDNGVVNFGTTNVLRFTTCLNHNVVRSIAVTAGVELLLDVNISFLSLTCNLQFHVIIPKEEVRKVRTNKPYTTRNIFRSTLYSAPLYSTHSTLLYSTLLYTTLYSTLLCIIRQQCACTGVFSIYCNKFRASVLPSSQSRECTAVC